MRVTSQRSGFCAQPEAQADWDVVPAAGRWPRPIPTAAGQPIAAPAQNSRPRRRSGPDPVGVVHLARRQPGAPAKGRRMTAGHGSSTARSWQRQQARGAVVTEPWPAGSGEQIMRNAEMQQPAQTPTTIDNGMHRPTSGMNRLPRQWPWTAPPRARQTTKHSLSTCCFNASDRSAVADSAGAGPSQVRLRRCASDSSGEAKPRRPTTARLFTAQAVGKRQKSEAGPNRALHNRNWGRPKSNRAASHMSPATRLGQSR